jgi:predicted acylesterase/phospholipase RssA
MVGGHPRRSRDCNRHQRPRVAMRKKAVRSLSAKHLPKTDGFQSHSRRTLLGSAAGGGLSALLSGCSLPVRGPGVPMGQTTKASVLGIPNERFFPIYGTEPLEAEFQAAGQRQRRTLGLSPGAPLPEIQLLAVSGGGENGAFGAGVLCGWSEHGTRPVFELVTGVSTGALTAPFAYLGSGYDPQLRSVYTELSPTHVLFKRYYTAALFDDAMTDNDPLFKTISGYLTEDMQAALAKAYDDGRLLLIGTTDLDAQQPVIWNIGAIARSGHPRALETIRRVLLASAAIPGAFPPTMFDVTLDGRPYQEMHVDGGAFAQAFLYPVSMTKGRRERMARGQYVVPTVAYIIRNARLDPEWATVERRTLGIAARAISTMIAASGYNDVMRSYSTTLRDGVDYNLAYIRSDFTMTLPEPFDPGFMRALYEYGYQRARGGYEWSKTPPI